MQRIVPNTFVFRLFLLIGAAGCAPSAPPVPAAPASPEPAAAPSSGATAPGAVPAAAQIPFRDVAADLGIAFERYDDFRGTHRLLEANGGGTALFDFDRDGWPDLFFTGGCRFPERGDCDEHHNVLYRSRAARHCNDVTARAGLTSCGYHTGCAVGDVDGDGFPDLLVTAAAGPCLLFLNQGDGTFLDTPAALPALVPLWSTSAAFGDVNDDGHLDLFICNYVADDPARPKLCPRAESPDGYIQCPPTLFPAEDDWLLLSDGRGGWRDVTTEAGIDGADGKGLGVVLCDLTRDGRLDIYVANDGTPCFLYVQAPPAAETDGAGAPLVPRFVESAFLYGCAVNALGAAPANMGVACGDYDRDGAPDLHVTTFFAESNVLYRNLQGASFADVTNESRLGPATRAFLGWGTMFFDGDHDGWLDLFVANGHVDDFSWLNAGEPYRMRPQLFHNEGDGRFSDVSRGAGTYFETAWLGRGAAAGDFDRDGDLDLAVSHQRAPSSLLLNDQSHGRHWLQVRLVGGRTNRSAVGARVEIDGLGPPLVRDVFGGGSFQSASDLTVHFGVGDATRIPVVRVRWPSGSVSEYADVAADRHYIAVEGPNVVHSLREWTPRP